MQTDREVMPHEAFIDFDAFRSSPPHSSRSAWRSRRVVAVALLAGVSLLGGIALGTEPRRGLKALASWLA